MEIPPLSPDELTIWFDPTLMLSPRAKLKTSMMVCGIWAHYYDHLFPLGKVVDYIDYLVPWIHIILNDTFRPSALSDYGQRVYINLMAMEHFKKEKLDNVYEHDVLKIARREWYKKNQTRLRREPWCLDNAYILFIQELHRLRQSRSPRLFVLRCSSIVTELCAFTENDREHVEAVLDDFVQTLCDQQTEKPFEVFKSEVVRKLTYAQYAINEGIIKVLPPVQTKQSYIHDILVFLCRIYSLLRCIGTFPRPNSFITVDRGVSKK